MTKINELTHRLTIEITSKEMKALAKKAAKQGFLPVAYLKYLALSPETQYYTANDFQAIEKELNGGN